MGFLPEELILDARKIIKRTRKCYVVICFLALKKTLNNFLLK